MIKTTAATLFLVTLLTAGCRQEGPTVKPIRGQDGSFQDFHPRDRSDAKSDAFSKSEPGHDSAQARPDDTHVGTSPNVQRDSLDPPTGQRCRIQFRRDAMGAASAMPLSVSIDSPAGRAVQVSGTLERVTGEWLVLREQGRTYWIPRSVVLTVEFEDTR